MTGELVYLYAVQSSGGAAPDAPGVDGETPRLVGEGPLAAVVGTVAAARFGEEPLQHDLEDLSALERLARAHHAVVSAAAEGGTPVAPLRLATVYRDDAAVRLLLRERCADLSAVLAGLEGRREWGVKASVPDDPTDSAGPTEPAASAPDPSRPGTAYLLRRRAGRDRTVQLRERALERAAVLHDAVAAHAVEHHRFPGQDPRLSGRSGEMVLNASYLVETVAEEAFRAAAAAEVSRDLRVEVTGPWPPFSFATLEPA